MLHSLNFQLLAALVLFSLVRSVVPPVIGAIVALNLAMMAALYFLLAYHGARTYQKPMMILCAVYLLIDISLLPPFVGWLAAFAFLFWTFGLNRGLPPGPSVRPRKKPLAKVFAFRRKD